MGLIAILALLISLVSLSLVVGLILKEPWKLVQRESPSVLGCLLHRIPGELYGSLIQPSLRLTSLKAHWDYLLLLLLFAMAMTIRLVHLDVLPSNVTADELDNLQTAYLIIEGHGPGWYGLDWKPSPSFSTRLISISVETFGANITSLRLPSAILSSFAILPFYFLARQVVSKPVALIAVLLLGSNLWYLHFSRSGWENVHGALYGTSAALCLTLALRGQSWTLYAATGLFCTLGLLGFFSSAFIVAGIVAYLPFAIFLDRARWKSVLLGYALIAAITILLFVPQLKIFIAEWDYATRRIQTISVFAIDGEYLGDNSIPVILTHQAIRVIQSFFLMDSPDYGLWGRYIPIGRGFLNFGTSFLFWIGLFASFYYWRTTILWWAMFLAFLVPQVFSTGSPNAATATPTAPFMYLFVALGIYVIFNCRRKLIARLHPSWVSRSLATITLLFLVTWLAISDIKDYYLWIKSPDALLARAPYVDFHRFSEWQGLARQEAIEGRLLPHDDWLIWLDQHHVD